MELRRDNRVVLDDLGYVPGVQLAPRRVDFNLVFPNEQSRSEAKDAVLVLGFDWSDSDEAVKEGAFEATAIRVLSPAVDPITECEIALIECLSPFGGNVDGWGFFRDTEH